MQVCKIGYNWVTMDVNRYADFDADVSMAAASGRGLS